jgi:hypothetical protein
VPSSGRPRSVSGTSAGRSRHPHGGSTVGLAQAVLGVWKIGAVVVPATLTTPSPARAARLSTDAVLVVAERSLEPTIERMGFTPGSISSTRAEAELEGGPNRRPTHDTASATWRSSSDERRRWSAEGRRAYPRIRLCHPRPSRALARRRTRRHGVVHCRRNLPAHDVEHRGRAVVARARSPPTGRLTPTSDSTCSSGQTESSPVARRVPGTRRTPARALRSPRPVASSRPATSIPRSSLSSRSRDVDRDGQAGRDEHRSRTRRRRSPPAPSVRAHVAVIDDQGNRRRTGRGDLASELYTLFAGY